MLEKYDRAFLSPDEVATELGANAESIRRMCKDRAIPALKVGSRWRIPKEWLESTMRGERANA